ncbi:hypothetical protein SUDANB121_03831 [Nocardiopsis dassonvillei]
MTYDVVALTARVPDPQAVSEAFRQAGSGRSLDALSGGNILRLCDPAGRPLVTLEPPQSVGSRAEVARLLGQEAVWGLPDPCWWVELRARPDQEGRDAAHRVADALALGMGGSVWTSGPGDLGPWEDPGPSEHTGAVSGHPAVERVAGSTFVIAQDRDVVPLSSWITDALFSHGLRGPGFQLLTPASARLTYALRTLMSMPKARWVVRTAEEEYIDGSSGVPLRWDDGEGFVPTVTDPAAFRAVEGFDSSSEEGLQLLVNLTVDHRGTFAPPFGRSVEILTGLLAGAVPGGWGTHEPALAPWDRERLVRLIRSRFPRSGRFHFSAPAEAKRSFTGSLRVEWSGERAREQISLVIGYGPGERFPSAEEVASVVEALAAEGLLSQVWFRKSRGRADTTCEARWTGVPGTVGMAVGPREAARLGDGLSCGPVEGVPLGGGNACPVWFPFPEDDAGALRSAELARAQALHLARALPPMGGPSRGRSSE